MNPRDQAINNFLQTLSTTMSQPGNVRRDISGNVIDQSPRRQLSGLDYLDAFGPNSQFAGDRQKMLQARKANLDGPSPFNLPASSQGLKDLPSTLPDIQAAYGTEPQPETSPFGDFVLDEFTQPTTTAQAPAPVSRTASPVTETAIQQSPQERLDSTPGFLDSFSRAATPGLSDDLHPLAQGLRSTANPLSPFMSLLDLATKPNARDNFTNSLGDIFNRLGAYTGF